MYYVHGAIVIVIVIGEGIGTLVLVEISATCIYTALCRLVTAYQVEYTQV
jgi:hypothetical protein